MNPDLPASEPPRGDPASRTQTVLLVDDELSVLNALRRLFRKTGYDVLLAQGGVQALALMRTQPVDLVLSDMRMPEMDGASLLEAVRLHDPGIVRILLTGYADITSTVAAINRGAIHRYIAKPWDDQDLLLAVGDALARRALEQQNERLRALTLQQNDALLQLNQQLEARVAARTAELEQVNAMLNLANAELKSQFTLAVTVFSGLLELRRDGIAGHSRRVASLARRIGVEMGLDERALQDVMLGGLLHDIGKIAFPDSMLGKPVSTYNPLEVARYRRHALDGEAALLTLPQLQGVARIVRQHHERVDGLGFPDGLRADEIALGARIVAVASDHDGLLHGNLAERRHSVPQALQALRGGVGSHYDAKVVAALTAVLACEASSSETGLVIDVRQLVPGMVLAQDLLSAKGVMLLPAGHVFDARVIRQLAEIAERNDLTLRVTVRHESTSPAAPTGAQPALANTTP